MAITNTDAVLWYNVGVFGEAGYAVPNWSDDIACLNPTVHELVSLAGQNLFAIMHHEDADLRVPPSINTCVRVHKLYLRLAQVLSGRAIPPGQFNMETSHVRPAGQVYVVFPCPYFKVRNRFMRQWAGWVMMMLSEAMQHTESRKEIEISTAFAGDIGQYMKRVYVNMAVELFQKKKEDAEKDGFALTDADFAAYNPAAFFTSTEMVDTVSRFDRIFTEDQLAILRQGIPVNQLPDVVKPWPLNITNAYAATRTDETLVDGGMSQVGSAASTTATAPILPPPTGP